MTPPFYSPALAAKLLPPSVRYTDDNILAALKKLRYPVLLTDKIDGVRGLRLDAWLKSRTRKKIPNKLLCERSLIMPGGFDCEIADTSLEFNDIQSIVMSEEHPDTLRLNFHVLDWFSPGTYYQRTRSAVGVMHDMPPYVKMQDPILCESAEIVFWEFLRVEREKGEGVCFRLPDSPYKPGYSTLNEQYLVKLARFIYEEATIVGFEEQCENGNPEKRNALGRMKRQTLAENMIPKGTLGALWVKQETGEQFKVAIGIKDRLRKQIWDNRKAYLGKQITFKHKPKGRLSKPRSPVFVGFRKEGF